MTVQELTNYCLKQIKLGNADKKILISGDDEGNYWHELMYEFEIADSEDYENSLFQYSEEEIEKFKEDYILLG